MAIETPPSVITPSKEYKELQGKLDEIDERVDNTNAEIMQRLGKKIGRDIGIVYGFIIGIIIYNIIMIIDKILSFISNIKFL